MALGLLIGFLIIIIVGLPVGFAMGVISIVSIGILDGSMLIIPQKLFSAINNFTYLCIPLYVLAAEIMSVGGLTEKIVHFCDCLVGHIHGGLSHVNVLGSMFFAGISGSATADVSGLGRLEIDMQGRNVFVDGEKLELTPKEYELLFYLVKNNGIALSREKLLSDVWGFDFYGDDRTVDTHIKMLRSSLGEYRKFIVTLRGMGYKFEA